MKFLKKCGLTLWIIMLMMNPMMTGFSQKTGQTDSNSEQRTRHALSLRKNLNFRMGSETSQTMHIIVGDDDTLPTEFMHEFAHLLSSAGYTLAVTSRSEPSETAAMPVLRLTFDQDSSAVQLELLAHPLRKRSPILVDLPEPALVTGSTEEQAAITAVYALYASEDCQAAQALASSLTSQTGTIKATDESGDVAFNPAQHTSALRGLIGMNCIWLGEDANTSMLMNHDVFRASPHLDIAATINLAWSALQIGNQDIAFRRLDELAARWRDDLSATVEILRKQSQFHALVNDFDSAIDAVQQSIHQAEAAEDFPIDALAALYIQRGQVRVLLYEWDAAISDYTTALELAPDDEAVAPAYYFRGIVYYTTLLDRELALPDFERYLALAPYGEHRENAIQYREDIQAELEALSG